MALPIDYLVYGNITDSSSVAVVGATVTVTGAAGSVATTTTTGGYYQINIKAACNADGETVTVSCTYGIETASDTFTLHIAFAAENVDLQLGASSTVAVKPYAVFVANVEIPNVFQCKFEDPSITTSTIPTFEVVTDNITGRHVNEYNVGEEVLIYRYGILAFKGIVQPRNFEVSADGNAMTFGGNHKGYDFLANRVCDYYRTENLSYAPVVNPWRFGRKTDDADTLVDGCKPNEIIECLIGERLIWQEWFDNHDYLKHYGETVYASNVAGGTEDTFGENKFIYQNFQVTEDVTITEFAIKMKKNGIYPTVGFLMSNLGGEPDSLLSATTPDTPSEDYGWVHFVLTSPYSASTGTTYGIQIRSASPSAGTTSDFSIKKSTNNPYSNGNYVYSTNNGSTWTQESGSDIQFKIYGKKDEDTLAVIDGVLRLPKADTTTTADSYATSGQVESIDLHNGDKYVDEMGEISSVSATLVGTRYGAYNPVLMVCRNASESSRTWHTLSTSYDGDGVWTGSYIFADSPTTKNEFAFLVSMDGDGNGSTEIEYARFDCFTASDTSVTAGTISTYDDPNTSDDTIAINLASKTRLEAIETVRKLTNTSTVYADPNWDCYIDNSLQLHFQEARGSDIDETFSFDRSNLTKLNQKFDGEIKNSLIAIGQGEEPYAVTITGSTLQDATSIATYGQKTGYFIDKSIPDAPTLYKRAKAYLKYMKDPRESIDVEITNDLALDWDVGDRIKINDDELALSDQYYRVVSREFNYSQEDGETIDIELNSKSDTMADVFKNIQGKFNSQEVITQGTSSPTNTIASGLVYDSSYSAEYTFYVPENAQRVLISARTHKYRAYSKAAEGGGAVTTTTAESAGTTSTTADGGASTPTSDTHNTGEWINRFQQVWDAGQEWDTDTWTAEIWVEAPDAAFGSYEGCVVIVALTNQTNGTETYDVRIRNKTTSSNLWTDTWTLSDATGYTHYHNFNDSDIDVDDEIAFQVTDGTVGTDSGRGVLGYMQITVQSYSSHDHDVTIGTHNHNVTVPAHDHNVTVPNHTHDLTFGIYEYDYYPAQTCMRIDSLNSPAVQKFGYIGSEDTGAEVIDLDITDELKDETGKIMPGRHTLYFGSQASATNTTGLGVIGVNHKIVVKTAEEVSLTPL